MIRKEDDVGGRVRVTRAEERLEEPLHESRHAYNAQITERPTYKHVAKFIPGLPGRLPRSFSQLSP